MSQDGDESKKQKIEKKFSIQLVELAMSEELESHEIALVLGLLLKKLDLSRKKTLKFLSKCGVSDPQVLASLGDSGLLNLSPIEIIDLIATSTSNLTEYMAKIEDCLEQKLLSLSDEDTIEAVRTCAVCFDCCFHYLFWNVLAYLTGTVLSSLFALLKHFLQLSIR